MDKVLKDIKGIIKISNKRDFFIGLVPYLGFFYIGNIFSKHIRVYVGGSFLDRIFKAVLEIDTMSYVPSFHIRDVLAGVIVAGVIKLIVYNKGKNAKKFREGEEYGSARWGTKKDGFRDECSDQVNSSS